MHNKYKQRVFISKTHTSLVHSSDATKSTMCLQSWRLSWSPYLQYYNKFPHKYLL